MVHRPIIDVEFNVEHDYGPPEGSRARPGGDLNVLRFSLNPLVRELPPAPPLPKTAKGCYPLRISCYSLLTPCYLLVATCYLLFATYYVLLTTSRLLGVYFTT